MLLLRFLDACADLQFSLFVSFLRVCSKWKPINFLKTMWDNANITNLLQTFAVAIVATGLRVFLRVVNIYNFSHHLRLSGPLRSGGFLLFYLEYIAFFAGFMIYIDRKITIPCKTFVTMSIAPTSVCKPIEGMFIVLVKI